MIAKWPLYLPSMLTTLCSFFIDNFQSFLVHMSVLKNDTV